MIIQNLIDQINDLNVSLFGDTMEEKELNELREKSESELIETREKLVRILYYE